MNSNGEEEDAAPNGIRLPDCTMTSSEHALFMKKHEKAHPGQLGYIFQCSDDIPLETNFPRDIIKNDWEDQIM